MARDDERVMPPIWASAGSDACHYAQTAPPTLSAPATAAASAQRYSPITHRAQSEVVI